MSSLEVSTSPLRLHSPSCLCVVLLPLNPWRGVEEAQTRSACAFLERTEAPFLTKKGECDTNLDDGNAGEVRLQLAIAFRARWVMLGTPAPRILRSLSTRTPYVCLAARSREQPASAAVVHTLCTIVCACLTVPILHFTAIL